MPCLCSPSILSEKISKPKLPDVFRVYRRIPLAWNGLILLQAKLFTQLFQEVLCGRLTDYVLYVFFVSLNFLRDQFRCDIQILQFRISFTYLNIFRLIKRSPAGRLNIDAPPGEPIQTKEAYSLR